MKARCLRILLPLQTSLYFKLNFPICGNFIYEYIKSSKIAVCCHKQLWIWHIVMKILVMHQLIHTNALTPTHNWEWSQLYVLMHEGYDKSIRNHSGMFYTLVVMCWSIEMREIFSNFIHCESEFVSVFLYVLHICWSWNPW